MTASGPLMLLEARQAGQVIRAQRENRAVLADLATRLRRDPPNFAVTVARGSSDHACTVLKYALETTLGLPVASVGPSVHTLYGASLRLRGALVLAVSQSGASPDVVETVRMARAAGALTVALVNQPGSDLEGAAEFVVPLRAGEERAVAATKSFLGSLSALLPLLAQLAPDPSLDAALDRLPDALDHTGQLTPAAHVLADTFAGTSQLLVLGRGLHYGAAHETALKFKETSGIHAEAYSAAEFSHGPRRLLAEGLPVLGFTPVDAAGAATRQAFTDLTASGTTLHTIGPAQGSSVQTPATGHPLTDVLPSVLAAYLCAAQVALARGLDPDHPPLLHKVTRTR